MKLIREHFEPDFATESRVKSSSDGTGPANKISAVMQELHTRLRLCNSDNIKFISATGQNPPVVFTMPLCKNYKCDSGCAFFNGFNT